MHIKLSCFLLLLALCSSTSLTRVCASSSADSAIAAIDRARSSLIDAYISVLEAEKEGADVTSLTRRLTEAGSDLTNACLFYETGSYDAAVTLADSSYEAGQKVEIEAADLKAVTHVNAKILFSFQMLGYVGTLAVIVFVAVLGWRTFRERYYQKILEMKPEATDTES